MTASDSRSFREHPFCVTICIFNVNKQDATNISANEGKTNDISDGYRRLYLPLPTFPRLLSFRLPPLTFFPSSITQSFKCPHD